MSALPVTDVLPDLLSTLRSRSNAVLVAPPGAGKTTAVAPALLAEPWCDGEIILLSPRRLAARAAAERMAALAGEPVGKTFGYTTRLDSKRSAETRVTVVTEGIFVRKIQSDIELSGVSAVLFDEVHERSLDSDFALALALDAQSVLRPDLRLLAMSATLDGARFSALLGDAPVIESEGRSYPLELRHVGRNADARIEDMMAATVRRALSEAEGGILAFLPGVGEIERTAERLGDIAGVKLYKLHGQADPRDQRAAIAPETGGLRKLVLATSIAETSLTLDGINIVIDSGLARRPRYDRAAGMTRLVTERASQAAVTQRAGRAARQGPGIAYRLWEEAATKGLAPFDPPEILEADLSGLLLDCAIWGVRDPRQLKFLDPPTESAVLEAQKRLFELDAIDCELRPTPHGSAIAAIPLNPRLAHMLVRAGELKLARTAAVAAVLLSERGLGGHDPDLESRLRRWRTEKGARAKATQQLATRWEKFAPKPVEDVAPIGQPDEALAVCIALAYPDRVARRRDQSGEHWASVGGRGFRLDPASSLARSDWLAVAEIQGAASGARILSAAPISQSTVEALFGGRIEVARTVDFDIATKGVLATRVRRLGAIRLSSGPDSAAEPEAIARALIEGVRSHGLDLLPWPEAATALRQRARFAASHGAPDIPIDDHALLASIEDWLPPLLVGKRRLDQVSGSGLMNVLEGLLGWDALQLINKIAPAHFESPAGSSHAIDYGAEGGPTVELRVQALFGLSSHPSIGGGAVPLILSLTSPAGRPIQTTRNLPAFWAGSWRDVAKEMRGRYPRHPWPDHPAEAAPTLRTKKADARRGN